MQPSLNRGNLIRLRWALGTATAAATICVLAPAIATAAIIPGQGIAAPRLGDSTARVSALLGKPGQLQTNGGGEQNWLYYGKGPIDWVTAKTKGAKKTVEGMETSDPKQRTAKVSAPARHWRPSGRPTRV
jgi:hypothetical protein